MVMMSLKLWGLSSDRVSVGCVPPSGLRLGSASEWRHCWPACTEESAFLAEVLQSL